MKSAFDLRRLRFFVAVAKEGSVTRAARSLLIAQPALSQHLRALEEDLGVRLFERGARGMSLTEAGHRLRAEAPGMLEGMRKMLERVAGEVGEPEGEVAVGFGQVVGSMILSRFLEAARARLPGVRIAVVELPSARLPDLLRAGELDFALTTASADRLTGLDAVPVLADDMCLIGRRKLAQRWLGKAAAGATVRLAQLKELPLYLPSRPNELRSVLERSARRARVALDIVAEVESFYSMKQVALDGAGFTVFAGSAVQDELEERGLYVARIVSPALRRNLFLLRRHGEPVSRAGREVAALAMALLLEQVGKSRQHRSEVLVRPDEVRRWLN